ncbi:MAG: MCP four helix bundle domain-containing protein [Magnetococcales bacterium]|nr:MCP four helix bundle domain-containing protein [Magnetococcales bacterium]
MASLLDQSVLEITRGERNIILSDNPRDMLRFAREITQAHDQLQRALERLRELSTSGQEQEILGRIDATIGSLIAIDREVQRLGMLNSNVRATGLSENAGRQAMLLAQETLEQGLSAAGNAYPDTLIREMQLLLMTIQRDEIHMILTTDENKMVRDAQAMERDGERLNRHREQLGRWLTGERGEALLAEFDAHLKSYLEISRQVRSLTLENGNHKAIRLSQEQGRPVLLQLRDLLLAFSASSEARMNEARRQSNRDYRIAFAVLSAMLCLSIVVGTIIALRISRDVNRGLTRAIRTVEAVARGDLEEEAIMAPAGIRDEFGQLMEAMRRLVDAESRVADMAQRLARDDLSVTVEERSGSDRLLAAMKHLAMALRERAELRRMLLVSEKMSSIGQFAVRVAHEINNPLSTAAMGLQNVRLLLPPHSQDPAVTHRLNQVESNIERATRVARQMLEYSWTGQPECAYFNLRDELNEVLELVQADGGPVDITLEMEETLRMWGDRVKIGQVMRNLLQNALDATRAGGEVVVSAGCERGFLVARVRDRGPGLAPEADGKIFDPFFTTKKSGIGVGLGLPICYSIVRQHGGTLEVVNGEGGGVLATLRLPLAPQ